VTSTGIIFEDSNSCDLTSLSSRQAPDQAKNEEEDDESAARGKAGESKEEEAKREKRESKHRKNKGIGDEKVPVVHVPLTGLKAALETNK
jgi:hypothetical protein